MSRLSTIQRARGAQSYLSSFKENARAWSQRLLPPNMRQRFAAAIQFLCARRLEGHEHDARGRRRWFTFVVVWLIFAAAAVVFFHNHPDAFAPGLGTLEMGLEHNPQPVLLCAVAVGALIMITVWFWRR